jgi:hypothetical protein
MRVKHVRGGYEGASAGVHRRVIVWIDEKVPRQGRVLGHIQEVEPQVGVREVKGFQWCSSESFGDDGLRKDMGIGKLAATRTVARISIDAEFLRREPYSQNK